MVNIILLYRPFRVWRQLSRLHLYFHECAGDNGLAVCNAQGAVINQTAGKAAFAGNFHRYALRNVHAVIAEITEQDCPGGEDVYKRQLLYMHVFLRLPNVVSSSSFFAVWWRFQFDAGQKNSLYRRCNERWGI